MRHCRAEPRGLQQAATWYPGAPYDIGSSMHYLFYGQQGYLTLGLAAVSHGAVILLQALEQAHASPAYGRPSLLLLLLVLAMWSTAHRFGAHFVTVGTCVNPSATRTKWWVRQRVPRAAY